MKREGRKRGAEGTDSASGCPARSRRSHRRSARKLSDLGEFGLIDRIRALSPPGSRLVLTGIGDDAAMMKVSPGHHLLVTTDLLLEQVHFDLSFTDYYSLGWKSAAVNLSDIAAMGGIPRFCLAALGIPETTAPSSILDFYRGFNALLRKQTTDLVGGDTCSSPGRLFISITAIGEAGRSTAVQRSGAGPGDRIFVTGTLGDSAAGLEILRGRAGCGARSKKNRIRNGESAARRLIERHLRPEPRVACGRKLAVSGCASAMIDVSDGLASDLGHICRESGVGADIRIDRIPLSADLHACSPALIRPVLEYALSGGEDYELLFTVPANRLEKLRTLKLPVTEIGTITAGKKIFLADPSGGRRPLAARGFDHFRPAAPAGTPHKKKSRVQ